MPQLRDAFFVVWAGRCALLGSVYYWRRAAGRVSPRRARYFSCAAKKSTQKKAAPAACDPSRCEGQPVSWRLRGVPRNSLRAVGAPFEQTRQASSRSAGTLRCQRHPANVTPQAHAKGGGFGIASLGVLGLGLWRGVGWLAVVLVYWFCLLLRRAAGRVSPRRARYFSCAAKKSTQKKAAPAACDPSRCEGQPVSWRLRGVPRNSLRAESAPFGQTRQASSRCTGTLRCQCHPANTKPQAHAKGGMLKQPTANSQQPTANSQQPTAFRPSLRSARFGCRAQRWHTSAQFPF